MSLFVKRNQREKLQGSRGQGVEDQRAKGIEQMAEGRMSEVGGQRSEDGGRKTGIRKEKMGKRQGRRRRGKSRNYRVQGSPSEISHQLLCHFLYSDGIQQLLKRFSVIKMSLKYHKIIRKKCLVITYELPKLTRSFFHGIVQYPVLFIHIVKEMDNAVMILPCGNISYIDGDLFI
jgi:hypothetical protein